MLTELTPSIVLTASWLSLGGKADFEAIFRRTGLNEVANAFDARPWQAPALRSETRKDAIQRWSRHTGSGWSRRWRWTMSSVGRGWWTRSSTKRA